MRYVYLFVRHELMHFNLLRVLFSKHVTFLLYQKPRTVWPQNVARFCTSYNLVK